MPMAWDTFINGQYLNADIRIKLFDFKLVKQNNENVTFLSILINKVGNGTFLFFVLISFSIYNGCRNLDTFIGWELHVLYESILCFMSKLSLSWNFLT